MKQPIHLACRHFRATTGVPTLCRLVNYWSQVRVPPVAPPKKSHFRGHLSRSIPSTRPVGRDALGQFRLHRHRVRGRADSGHAAVNPVPLARALDTAAPDAAAAGVAFGYTALIGFSLVGAPVAGRAAARARSAVSSRGSSCERDRSSVRAPADRPHLGTDLGTKFCETAPNHTAFSQHGRLLFQVFAGRFLHHAVGGTRRVGAW